MRFDVVGAVEVRIVQEHDFARRGHRGETSLGGLFAARGVPSVPSPREVLLLEDPYFNGAYDIAAHGSRDKSQLDAAQLEVPGPMRDTPAHRAATAAAIAESLDVYFARHFGMKLK